MVWVLLPFIVFFVVARLHLGGGVGIGLLLGYVELAIVGVLAAQIGTRVLKLPRPSVGALILTVILANTGYLGTPLAGALLGHDALAPAIAWDTVISPGDAVHRGLRGRRGVRDRGGRVAARARDGRS